MLGSMVRAGRLERTLPLMPPTQSQREVMLRSLLAPFLAAHVPAPEPPPSPSSSTSSVDPLDVSSDSPLNLWSRRIAEATPGFIAQDLVRLCDRADVERLARVTRSSLAVASAAVGDGRATERRPGMAGGAELLYIMYTAAPLPPTTNLVGIV